MKRQKKVLCIALLVVFCFVASGCPRDPYRAAIQGSQDVSQSVSSAIKITAVYYSNGTFNDGQKATAAKYFTIVTDCNMAVRKAVTDVHNSGATGASAFLPIADSFVNCVRTSAPVSGDKTVANVLQSVDTAINGISLAVASAKGK
jgi:hypothetical protein